MSAFMQPPVPGYSPWPGARQDSPFLHTPGVQGLQEGISQGQGLGFSPQQEFFADGTEGTAPPSSVAPGNMWQRFGGGGEAPSSLAQPQAGSQPQMGMPPSPPATGMAMPPSPPAMSGPVPNPPAGFANAGNLAALLRGQPNAGA